jgi:hypothetical protein
VGDTSTRDTYQPYTHHSLEEECGVLLLKSKKKKNSMWVAYAMVIHAFEEFCMHHVPHPRPVEEDTITLSKMCLFGGIIIDFSCIVFVNAAKQRL